MKQYGTPGAVVSPSCVADQEVVFAEAHGALSKGKAYVLTCGAYGYKTAAIPAGGTQDVIAAIAVSDVASGAVGQFVVRGIVTALLDGTPTVGNGVVLDNSDADAKDVGSAFSGYLGDAAGTHCGIVLVAGTTGVADSVVFLHGYPVSVIA